MARRYREARRSSGASSPGDFRSPNTNRDSRSPAVPVAATTASGSASPAVSTMTRTAKKGNACRAATPATAALSISTTAAAVFLKAAALPETSSMARPLERSFPFTTVCREAMAAVVSSRQ
jgi:hypothetical protein